MVGDLAMNDRIKDLARKAQLLVHNPSGVPTKLERFAQLIVGECIDIAFQRGDNVDYLKEHFGIES
jgi:hypothetical protein